MIIEIRWMLCLTLMVTLALAIPAQAQQPRAQGKEEPPSKGSTLSFKPRRVVSPRPAIINAPFISANKVTDQVTENELVVGVVVNGEARAYPINMLTGPSREIINDTLGNRAIAATW